MKTINKKDQSIIEDQHNKITLHNKQWLVLFLAYTIKHSYYISMMSHLFQFNNDNNNKLPYEQAPRYISDMLTVYQPRRTLYVRWVQWHWWFQGLEHLAIAKENISVQQPSYGMQSQLCDNWTWDQWRITLQLQDPFLHGHSLPQLIPWCI